MAHEYLPNIDFIPVLIVIFFLISYFEICFCNVRARVEI